MLVFFVVARVKLICKVEYKKRGKDRITQNEPHCQPPWQFLDRVFNGNVEKFVLYSYCAYHLFPYFTFHFCIDLSNYTYFYASSVFKFVSTLNSRQWSRQNFSLQYQYDIRQTSDENKEKYQLGDYWLIQYQILKIHIIRIYNRQ